MDLVGTRPEKQISVPIHLKIVPEIYSCRPKLSAELDPFFNRKRSVAFQRLSVNSEDSFRRFPSKRDRKSTLKSIEQQTILENSFEEDNILESRNENENFLKVDSKKGQFKSCN